MNYFRLLCLLAALAALFVTPVFCGPATAQDGDAFHERSLEIITEPWTGDLDGMLQRRYIRALVVYSKTNYFLDGPTERGVTYETLKNFEAQLNAGRKEKVHILPIPVTHDQLIPMLTAGKGDIVAAMLTETADRRKLVDFSTPFSDQIRELVVTGPGSPKIAHAADLSGKTVYVRQSSSYFDSLQKLNRQLAAQGKPPAVIEPADENLEEEDILEMVNAGLIQITVVDNYLANFWRRIFTDLEVHKNFDLRSGGRLAWAFRHDSPKLAKAINEFVKKNKQGTLMGNILIKRYLQNTQWAKRAISGQDLARFKSTVGFFKQYAGQYSFDWLMITALAYQESGLDQSKRSPEGAVGVMQILPGTAAGHPIYITGVTKLDNNIHAGVKYLRHLYDENFKDDAGVSELNKVLFTFAAYNAGPAKVKQLRASAAKMGLNPNVWFGNVEQAAARAVGRETVRYVSNIFKYYIAYKQIAEQIVRQGDQREAAPTAAR